MKEFTRFCCASVVSSLFGTRWLELTCRLQTRCTRCCAPGLKCWSKRYAEGSHFLTLFSMSVQLVHHIVSSSNGHPSKLPHCWELSSEWSNQRMGTSNHTTARGNSAEPCAHYCRPGQWEKMDQGCPPQTKCCLTALGCFNVRGSCGLATLAEEEQKMSWRCFCDSSFFLSSCRARSRLRRSSKRFVFDWLFPHVGE